MFSYIKKYVPYMLILLFLGYLIYQQLHPPKPVTYQSQQQAETSQGIQQAAQDAQIEMQQVQLDLAAAQIERLKNQPPETVVRTVVKEVPIVIEQQRQAAKADFAIATNPAEPDKPIDIGKLPKDAQVTLNQYNIHAYKRILRQIDYAPRSLSDWSPREIAYGVSRKISNDGKYIGLVIEHDFDQDRTGAKIRFTY